MFPPRLSTQLAEETTQKTDNLGAADIEAMKMRKKAGVPLSRSLTFFVSPQPR
jgi:hypothetical protein